MTVNQLNVSDLPKWQSAPRVSGIPQKKGAWGLVSVTPYKYISDIVYDEAGFLWADANKRPVFGAPEGNLTYVILFCSKPGSLGIYLPRSLYGELPSLDRNDMDLGSGKWIPIHEYVTSIPNFVRASMISILGVQNGVKAARKISSIR